jgi:predicted small metal-binding protein
LKQAAERAQAVHNLQEMTEVVMEKVCGAIQDE